MEIFDNMHDGPVSERKFYTPSLTKIQRSFIKRDRPAQLKRLIQYVKYWKNTMMQVKVKQHLFLIKVHAIPSIYLLSWFVSS